MTRDKTLDILKGLGALLMIVAHASLNLNGYDRFKFWGGLAPVLFYAAAGVTAAFQAKKYQPRGVLLTYALLFLLGFSFNRITDPGFLQEVEFDIIQMIAFGASAVYLLEVYLRPPAWSYLLMGALAFALKFALQIALVGILFPGINFLIPPGIFPIFPWLFLFFFGVFAHRAPNLLNLALAASAALALLRLPAAQIPLNLENKWDMSAGYFLAASALLFSAFFLLRLVAPLLQKFPNGLLAFLGKNSLLFLYAHFPILLEMKALRLQRSVEIIYRHPYLFWILGLGLTLAAMWILLRLADFPPLKRVFNYPQIWLAMATLVFAAGLFIPYERAVYFIEIGLGLLTALFYPRLKNILKQP